ncbi:transducin family protein / WD-40 repeat family protein [Artemisia annua]|uniref:Transducin family protein / WD-40 repeat family protein n=1 Tax=Artemisia annua TaxID=35608 RepID=A0A2U1NRP8_ARTAN|nr:transducin family protein / WD-40 repeat family protein [Artemisia annua]
MQVLALTAKHALLITSLLTLSVVLCRPFKSWANNREWSMRFEEEEVRAVALGSSWFAAVTSLNFLRIGWFTEACCFS